ncbi:MAG: sensor histidine kinase [Sporocytophaga sp.]|uniref:sensor histidine kinase n=1 Tax=Sporocytophaga sp. TaxID=2231183 RepID=UPI001AFD22D2|nr:sensor histidine kinase [Sporocytophaga sp.]MBO9701470.1 sensor histidine kinase [Sporocytophaga sp.]
MWEIQFLLEYFKKTGLSASLKLLLGLLAIICSTRSLYASTKNPVIITDNRFDYSISERHFSITEDPSDRLAYEDFIDPAKSSLLIIPTKQKLYNYNPTSSYWINTDIHFKAYQKNKWILEVLAIHSEEVDLYLIEDGKLTEFKKTGEKYSFYERDYPTKNIIFDLPLKPNHNYKLLLRLKSQHHVPFQFKIRSQQQFSYYATHEYLYLGIYYGILLIITLYNALIYTSTKEKVYLYYVIYVFTAILLSLTEDGFGFQFIWKNYPEIIPFLYKYIAPSLFLCSSVFYFDSFMGLKRRFPAIRLVVFGTVAIYFLFFSLNFIYIKFNFPSYIFYAIPFLVVLCCTLYMAIRGYYPARIFIIAYTFICVSIIIKILQVLSIVKPNILTTYSFNYGITFEVVLLSFALADRFRTIKREKERAQKSMIQELKENQVLKDQLILEYKKNEALNEKITKELEAQVAERTRELQEKNIELDTFVFKASHDIKGPLKSIIALTKIGMKDIQDPSAEPYMQHILKSSEKLDKLLFDLLSITKVKKTNLSYEVIDFNLMVADALSSFKNFPEFPFMTFDIHINETEKFHSDKNLIKSIIQNLIENPIKYRDCEKSESFLKIEITCNDEEAKLVFIDNGLGISGEYHTKIFEMFCKANENSNGTGLGLYIVKIALEKLNGKISLSSEPGKGSCFSVVIPNQKNVDTSAEYEEVIHQKN